MRGDAAQVVYVAMLLREAYQNTIVEPRSVSPATAPPRRKMAAHERRISEPSAVPLAK
jgi:hypothetical protein